jgi:hypothetical protein
MREWCLVSTLGTVVNMATTYTASPPALTEYQEEKGWKWVPVAQVNQSKLREYRYWNERP